MSLVSIESTFTECSFINDIEYKIIYSFISYRYTLKLCRFAMYIRGRWIPGHKKRDWVLILNIPNLYTQSDKIPYPYCEWKTLKDVIINKYIKDEIYQKILKVKI